MGEASVCKLYKKVAFSHVGPKEAIFTRLRCKQWSCDFCAKKNASIWRAFLKERLPDVSDNWWLVTLTAHPNTKHTHDSIDNLRKNIERLFKRIKRVFGGIDYVRTFERHPSSNRIHAHFVVSGLLPFVGRSVGKKGVIRYRGVQLRNGRKGVWSVRTWFKKNAHACEIGHICDVRPLLGDISRAIWYVTKYLTKSQQDFHVKGLRHVVTSRRIGSPKNEKVSEWIVAAYIVPHYFAPNTAIHDLNTGEVIDNNYWEVHSFYPYED